MVDPGMGLKRMLRCLAEGRPQGLVGVRLAHLASFVLPRFFKTIKRRATLGRALTRGTLSLRTELIKGAVSPPRAPAPTTIASDPAAVLFTSGATGPAKGAVYTHAMFLAQVGLIRHGFGIADGGVDLATFPLFSLFSAALGLTAVIPNMNPTKPGSADPKKIVSAIEDEKATSLFASPALLSVLSTHARETGLKLSGLTRVISAGAPVRPLLVASFTEALDPAAKLLTPYGATEAMPLTSIEAKEIAMVRGMTEQGFGMCVGRPLPGHEVVIIPITDQALESINPAKLMGMGEIGEITARGPVVSQGYFERPEETKLSLIKGPDGRVWRRMGDLGWRDAQGRVWFCGRKSQRVVTSQGTFFTICCEAVFNNHPKVRRSALVGVGAPTVPVVVVEPEERISKKAWPAMVEELQALARTNPRTRTINTFLLKNSFPVDIRHNAKISRERLSSWAAKALIMPESRE
jgi:acyl-CoA synthetase (AMP-forming)/AMP-acid ligase II